MTKIVHLADTHIHNLKDHGLYKIVFSTLYSQLEVEKPNYIVHSGDLFHNKVNLSPEAINIAGEFFNKLAKLAPTYFILGNHDCLVSNQQRLDSITPISSLITNPNFHFLKKSGVYPLGTSNCDLCVHSILDTGSFPDFIPDTNRISIALYHGVVTGVVVNEKFQLIGLPLRTFDQFDYTFLGDIHESNFILDKNGKVRYPGSMIQQHFGEYGDKGYLVWDIEDKVKYSCKFKVLENPQPYITIKVNKDTRLCDFDNILQDAKIRIINDSNLDNVKFRKLILTIKSKYKFKNVTILDQTKTEDIRQIDENTSIDNLHDINVHEKLLKLFFKDEKKEVLDKILELNRTYFNKLTSVEQDKVNNWNIISLNWSNLFNYGENNSINFNRLKGTIGVVGKNKSGKSSFIDSLLFSLFNKISKNLKTNEEIINNSKSEASGNIVIKANGELYNIKRKIIRSRGNKSSTSLELLIDNKHNNDCSRIETDKLIQKKFGTLESFLLTSVSSQFGFDNFIEKGSTKRKEILANFLELEIFDKLYEEVKDDFSFIKSSIRKMEIKNYDVLIKDLLQNIDKLSINKSNFEEEIVNLEKELDELKEKSILLSKLLENITKYEENFLSSIELIIETIKSELKTSQTIISIKKELYSSLKAKIKAIKKKLEVDVDKSKEILVEIKKKFESVNEFTMKLESLKAKKIESEKNSKLLQDVPCKGDVKCKFLQNAIKSADKFNKTCKEIEENILEKAKLEAQIAKLDGNFHRNAILEHQEAQNSLRTLEEEYTNALNVIEKRMLSDKDRGHRLLKAEKDLEDYKNNESNISKIKELKEINLLREITGRKLLESRSELQKLSESLFHALGTKDLLEKEKKNYEHMLENYTIFEKYIKAVSSNGIPFTIIKNKLGIINSRLNVYLSGLPNFEIIFEENDNNLDINLRDLNGTRPINMGSGAEKMMASMAIRLALLSVSNLPRSNIFVLDEPGTSFDEDNMEYFVQMLDMIKIDFPIIFLISHIEALKDCCDIIIDIAQLSEGAKITI